jgi:hypothetical protein
VCSDTQFDPNNCGKCGTKCQPGHECRGGHCK